ncbi:hypothetical protein [Stenotrophomonas sp. 59]|uniref:hypothetical protein n=1 Tax=Stenotrophomonas sp. 59 TaxID=3051120 RepID=UPI00256F4496|nr:hypothetical protein [Stenotrophomonas sp. 59]
MKFKSVVDVAACAVALCLLLPVAAYAQRFPGDPSFQPSVFPAHMRLVGASGLQAQTADSVFGESVSPSSGSTVFLQSDIRLEGTGPDIAVVRKFDVSRYAALGLGWQRFGDWEMFIPRISTFGLPLKANTRLEPGKEHELWQVEGSNPNARCSAFSSALMSPKNQVDPGLWWPGVFLESAPGGGEELLKRDAGFQLAPAGGSYPIVTRSNWAISCLSQTRNGVTGEAFLAISPDGTKYWFDWFVVDNNWDLSDSGGWTIFRYEVSMYPTRIEDRHGNSLTYAWSGKRLQSITASDGRNLSFAYDGKDRISAISTNVDGGVRRWSYNYRPASNENPLGSLASAGFPDGSAWSFDMEDIRKMCLTYVTDDSPQGFNYYCDNIFSGGRRGYSARMVSPSGAKGEFVFVNMDGIRENTVADICWMAPPVYEYWDPCHLTSQSLRKKTLSGPGLPAQSWTYLYRTGLPADQVAARFGGSYAGPVNVMAARDPQGQWKLTFTGASGRDGLEGKILREDFGAKFDVEPSTDILDVYLPFLSSRETSSAGQTIREYQTVAAGYPQRPGIRVKQVGRGFQAWPLENFIPLRKVTTRQDGGEFVWEVQSFDSLARPARILERSN